MNRVFRKDGLVEAIFFFVPIRESRWSDMTKKEDYTLKAGRLKLKVLPFPTSLSTEIFPPCASINSLHMARPNPVPRALEPGTLKNRSNIFGKYSFWIPGP